MPFISSRELKGSALRTLQGLELVPRSYNLCANMNANAKLARIFKFLSLHHQTNTKRSRKSLFTTWSNLFLSTFMTVKYQMRKVDVLL